MKMFFKISLNFDLKGPIVNKSVLAEVMAWHMSGAMTFTAMILIKMSDIIWHH